MAYSCTEVSLATKAGVLIATEKSGLLVHHYKDLIHKHFILLVYLNAHTFAGDINQIFYFFVIFKKFS